MAMFGQPPPQALAGVAPPETGSKAAPLSQEQQGALQYQRGNKEKALEHFLAAARETPTDPAVQKTLADFYYVGLGKTDEAIRAYQSVLAVKPNNIETLQLLGNLCASMKRFPEAREYYGRVLKNQPWNSTVRSALHALPRQAAAATSGPDVFKNMITTAQRSVNGGEEEAVQTALDRLVSFKRETVTHKTSVPVEPVTPYESIQKLVGEGKQQEAISALEQFLTHNPRHALAHNDLGVLYYNTGSTQKSLEQYRTAVELDPANVIFQHNLAEFMYVVQGNTEEALRMYVKMLRERPRDVDVLRALSNICTDLGKNADALFFLETILEIEPWNQSARDQLAALRVTERSAATSEEYAQIREFAARGEIENAIRVCEQFVRAFPDHAGACNDLGVLYYQSGRVADAVMQYEEAVRLEPENDVFQKNLADFYFVVQGKTEEALQMYVKLLSKNPRDAESLMSIGRICEALGKTDDAKEFYRRASDPVPENTEIRQMPVTVG
jgi:tetratricopeptide (TPR) repeat protein